MMGESPSIQLQPRDLELFRGLLDSRIMTLRHIAAIHFDGHPEAAKKRVQRLKAEGYVRVRSQRANESAIYILTRKAFETLRQNGMLPEIPRLGWAAQEKRGKVSDLTLRHELGVMDCKAAMFTAVRTRPELSIVEFSTWPQKIQFEMIHPIAGVKVVVKPDGFICLEAKHESRRTAFFFLEADFSTESLETLAMKIRCYRNYYRQGGFAKRLGHQMKDYRKFPFRVLVVCISAKRCSNLAELLRRGNPPISKFSFITTAVDFWSDPLEVFGTMLS